jgi:hypothetical protein
LTEEKKVDSKWVFKMKRLADRSIDNFKAQLVAQGFTQCVGFDFNETYAPVFYFDSLHLLLAIMAVQEWRPQQVDVKSAVLYGDLENEIYMILPDGHQEKGKTAQLRKCIDDIKQSPQKW